MNSCYHATGLPYTKNSFQNFEQIASGGDFVILDRDERAVN
jgi:hypothetical protein